MKYREAIETLEYELYEEGHLGYVENELELAIEALRKQTPMQVKEIHVDKYFCPYCGAENNCNQGIVEDNYCSYCGQRLEGRSR